MLLPLFDLLNHNPATRIAWLADGARVSFVSEEWVGAGSEVFNNYGARPNEELLFSHGFALPGNQADATTLTPTLTLTLTLTPTLTPTPTLTLTLTLTLSLTCAGLMPDVTSDASE